MWSNIDVVEVQKSVYKEDESEKILKIIIMAENLPNLATTTTKQNVKKLSEPQAVSTERCPHEGTSYSNFWKLKTKVKSFEQLERNDIPQIWMISADQ